MKTTAYERGLCVLFSARTASARTCVGVTALRGELVWRSISSHDAQPSSLSSLSPPLLTKRWRLYRIVRRRGRYGHPRDHAIDKPAEVSVSIAAIAASNDLVFPAPSTIVPLSVR